MSTIKVDTIKNKGTSAINLPNNFKIGGLNILQGYTSSGSEPGSPSTGDYWWDSTNSKLYRYINGEFKEISIAGGMSATGFFSRASARWTYTNYHSDDWMRGLMTKQASDGSYYTVGEQIYSTDSAWLMKRDSNGVFQWIRGWGNTNMRAQTLVIDSSDNPICLATDFGYGDNLSGSYDPQTGYVIKFNSSGTKQYGHTFRFTSIVSNNSATGLNRSSGIDSHGNIWACFQYDDSLTSPQNYSKDVVGLVCIDSSDGSIKKVYLIPPTAQGGADFPRVQNSSNSMYIDSNDNMYLGLYVYNPSNTSYFHAALLKFDISDSNGGLSYTWSKLYGSSGNSYDLITNIDELSTGEIIVSGYERVEISGSNYYRATVGSLNASNGNFNWHKAYDHTFMEGSDYGMAVDGQDRIFIIGVVEGGITNGYNSYIREINSSNGAHVALFQMDPTGDPDHTFQSGTSYSATSQWRWHFERGTSVGSDLNGNVLITTNPNGNGFDYRPWLIKLPSTISAGTFGTQTGSYAGNLQIIANSSTPSDATYSPSAQTYATFSTITDVTSSFQMDTNYNSGSANDTVFTPTSDGVTHNATIS